METEIWKDIPGYEWKYQVSSLWNVKSPEKFSKIGRKLKWKMLKQTLWTNGYLYIKLYWNNKKNYVVQRLVWFTFLWLDLEWKWYKESLCVCHRDDNPLNNRLDNLFLWTQKDNMNDMYKKLRNWHTSKRVIQFTKEWEFIKEWDSMSDASNILNINQWIISNCCNWKHKFAWNFIWKFNYS